MDLVTLLDPAPTPLTEEEEAALRIQSIARGRRDRARVLRLKRAKEPEQVRMLPTTTGERDIIVHTP